jgi:CubicO group peptidase (beta-lactamase class C family)
LEGVVHDENAYVCGGVQGHAGLFGTARDIYDLLRELLSVFHGHFSACVFQRDILKVFWHRQEDTGRGLGFDSPSLKGASCGRYFSKKSVGHLGFTGTSFWTDPDRSVIIILLTNRVHPSRENIKIRAFRPKLHDAVMKNVANFI